MIAHRPLKLRLGAIFGTIIFCSIFLLIGAYNANCVWAFDTRPNTPAAQDSFFQRNILFNSSFECGVFGWGTQGVDELYGVIDASTAAYGRQSLRIDISKEKVPVYYNDFTYSSKEKATHYSIFNLSLSSVGYVPVKAGKQYALSVYLKADKEGIPVTAAIHESGGGVHPKDFIVGKRWERYDFTASPKDDAVFVTVGINTKDQSVFPASLWVDALQLEEGDKPSSYASEFPVEFGLETPFEGNIYPIGKTVSPRLTFYNSTDIARTVKWRIRVEDFFGRDYRLFSGTILVPANKTKHFSNNLEISDVGFFRLHVDVGCPGWNSSRQVRMAVIRPFNSRDPVPDGFLGINHAFISDTYMRLCGKMGVTWVRSWFTRWDDVEPVMGEFNFSEADLHAKRLQRLGFRYFLCLADPASEWSSSAPLDLTGSTGFEMQSRRLWWRPKDFNHYEEYVQRVIDHFSPIVKYFEILNEPNNRKGGEGSNLNIPKGYVNFVTFARHAINAVPSGNGQILGAGFYYLKGIDDGDLSQALSQIDILSEHTYPKLLPTEIFARSIASMQKWMKDARSSKPIWITEYGLYADDDPDPTTINSRFMIHEGNNSELLAATYAVKHHIVALSMGVEKLFYHIGNFPFQLNRESSTGFHSFFEYGGAPRKLYVTMNALASILLPNMKPVSASKDGKGLFAFEFGSADEHVAVIWWEGSGLWKMQGLTELAARGLTMRDVTGAVLSDLSALHSDSPIYVVAHEKDQAAALKAFVASKCRITFASSYGSPIF